MRYPRHASADAVDRLPHAARVYAPGRCLAWFCAAACIFGSGCIVSEGGGDGSDDGGAGDGIRPIDPRGADGAPVRRPGDPEDVNLRFARAAISPICSEDGDPAASIVLTTGDPCDAADDAPDRLELMLYAHREFVFPLELPIEIAVGDGRPLQGHYVDPDGERLPLIEGVVTLTRFDPLEGAAGRFEVFTLGWRPVSGAFAAGICGAVPDAVSDLPACFAPWLPEPEPEPGPEPDPEPGPWPLGPQMPSEAVPCPGIYGVTRWTIDEAGFDPWVIQPLLDADIASGALLIDLRLTTQPDALTVVDAVAHGGRPAPEVPPSDPMPVGPHVDGGFMTMAQGAFSVWLNAPSFYPGAVPLGWSLLHVRFIGRSGPACDRLDLSFEGAFDARTFTIPGTRDVDLDGDGIADDGFRVEGTMEAVRIDGP